MGITKFRQRCPWIYELYSQRWMFLEKVGHQLGFPTAPHASNWKYFLPGRRQRDQVMNHSSPWPLSLNVEWRHRRRGLGHDSDASGLVYGMIINRPSTWSWLGIEVLTQSTQCDASDFISQALQGNVQSLCHGTRFNVASCVALDIS